MTRFIYDQFTKQYIQELLRQLGHTKTSVGAKHPGINMWAKPRF